MSLFSNFSVSISVSVYLQLYTQTQPSFSPPSPLCTFLTSSFSHFFSLFCVLNVYTFSCLYEKKINFYYPYRYSNPSSLSCEKKLTLERKISNVTHYYINQLTLLRFTFTFKILYDIYLQNPLRTSKEKAEFGTYSHLTRISFLIV